MNPKKPYYTAKIQIQACYYEVFLNDIPIFSYGAKGGISNEIPLNNSILSSGKQTLKIRLTPMFNQPQLNEQVDLVLNYGYNELIGENKLSDYVQLGSFKLPNEIKDKRLPFYEVELPFEAIVPWDYQSILDNAQDLTPLENKMDATVRRFYDIITKKDSKSYFEMMEQSLIIQSETEYMSKEEKDRLYRDVGLSNIRKVLPLDDYNFKLYAKGKLVRFYSNNKDENGNRYLFKYTVAPLIEGKQEGEGAFNYLFYLPKGKTQMEVF
ncbi:hypothetical protein LUD75_18920 [Epilithonimonas sp. JDS]|uniref:hypothetical protein n=1 Tax=Epilithonimonas sp. JDS TaxID=2902797 RepID=UPI001E4EEE7C|nr:hypothetical protein [Epilithonimonas sp. JDS]MCD9856804.1 hypothetical protein [Epilithonimonas sp. JDS]